MAIITANVDPVKMLLKEIEKCSFKDGWSYKVDVTYINNPHSFYVRPQSYNQFMSTVQSRGDVLKKSQLMIGDIVIFQSKLVKDLVRGRIVFVEGQDNVTCDLFAIDIGFFENGVPLRKIWKTALKVTIPALAFHCKLENCKPLGERWQQDAIKSMEEYVRGKVVDVLIKKIVSEKFIVEISVLSPDDVAMGLILAKHATSDLLEEIDRQLVVYSSSPNEYTERIFLAKTFFHVRLLSGSFLNRFYVADIDDYNTYLEERNVYTAFAESQTPLTIDQLKLNSPVGVFYKNTNKYERALIKEIMPKKNEAKVQLVDCGKEIVAPVRQMRPIPDQYLSSAPVAIYCRLHISQYSSSNYPNISNLANFSYPGVVFWITIEEAGEGDSPTEVSVSGITI